MKPWAIVFNIPVPKGTLVVTRGHMPGETGYTYLIALHEENRTDRMWVVKDRKAVERVIKREFGLRVKRPEPTEQTPAEW